MRQPTHTIEQLGKAIRKQRKTEGVTQQELSNLCGLSTSFISDVERGKATVELGKVLFLMQYLGLDIYVVERGTRL